MYCKNCGKEISEDSKFCSSCGCNLESIGKDEAMTEQAQITTGSEPVIEEKEETVPAQAEITDKNEPVAEEKDTDSLNAPGDNESAKNGTAALPTQSGGVSSVIDMDKIKEKISEIDVDEIKDKTKSFAKKEVENYKNFKTLSSSQKAIRVLIPAILLMIIIAIIVPNGPSDEDYILCAYTVVSEQLKSPASATFSNEKVVDKDDYGRVLVTLSVDAENSFGAYVRTNYAIVIETYDKSTEKFTYNRFAVQHWSNGTKGDFYIEAAKIAANWDEPLEE